MLHYANANNSSYQLQMYLHDCNGTAYKSIKYRFQANPLPPDPEHQTK